MQNVTFNISWSHLYILVLAMTAFCYCYSHYLNKEYYVAAGKLLNLIGLFCSLILSIIIFAIQFTYNFFNKKSVQQVAIDKPRLSILKGVGLVALCVLFNFLILLAWYFYDYQLLSFNYLFRPFTFCLTHFIFVWLFNLSLSMHHFIGYNILLLFLIMTTFCYSNLYSVLLTGETYLQVPFGFFVFLLNVVSIPLKVITEKYLFSFNFISPFFLLVIEHFFTLALFSLTLNWFDSTATIYTIFEQASLLVFNDDEAYCLTIGMLLIFSKCFDSIFRILLNYYLDPMRMYISDIVPGVYNFFMNYPMNIHVELPLSEYNFTYTYMSIHTLFDLFAKFLITETIVFDYLKMFEKGMTNIPVNSEDQLKPNLQENLLLEKIPEENPEVQGFM